jgi:RecA-family ATPase
MPLTPNEIDAAFKSFGDEPPLPYVNMARWDSEPVPEQQWTVLNRIPRRQVALFSGEGAAGKSTIELHRSAAHALGRDWLGTMPEQGSTLFIDAEDDVGVMHRRLAAITKYYGVTFANLIAGGLNLISLVGCDAVLATVSRSGKIEPTPLYKQILEAAGDIKPISMTIASSANVYAGSEIDRNQVQQFIGLLTRLAIVSDGSVVLLSHPSLTGITTDTGLSGNTQWHNAVRARFYLKGVKPENGEEADSDLREIVFKKNNYGPISENMILRYSDGLFLPVQGVSSLDRAAQEANADAITIEQIRSDQMNLSNNPYARNYAPRIFAKTPEAKKRRLTERDFEAAMYRLIAAGKIKAEQYGRPSEPRYRLVLVEGGQHGVAPASHPVAPVVRNGRHSSCPSIGGTTTTPTSHPTSHPIPDDEPEMWS